MLNGIQKAAYFLLLMLSSNIGISNNLIPFDFVNGLILIEAEIDGHTGSFILDSGSNGVLLNSKSAHTNISYQTLSGIAEGTEKEISALRVGEFESKNLLGFATDLSNIETYLSRSISGIIGSAIFNPSSLTIDFINSEIVLSDDPVSESISANLSSIPYEVIDDLPVAQLSIGGQPQHFILDSGASSHFIDIKALDGAHSITPTGTSKTIYTAAAQKTSAAQYRIDNVIMGTTESTMEAYDKDFSPLAEAMDIPIVGLISLRSLGDKVYFDVTSEKVYF